MSLLSLSLHFFLAGLAAAAPFTERASAVPPSQDAFYRVPDNISDYTPGAIIQWRPTPQPMAVFSVAPLNLEHSWQALYRTTDSLGVATATVLTLLVPRNADVSKVLSYQVAEDAALLDCAPSYALQLSSATGPLLGTIITQAEILLVEAALEQGWVVIIPDHEGPQAAWLANALAGHATLDGIRAALASGAWSGIRADARVAIWGYSGGGIASGWAAELQPKYAPELADRLVGAAIGGLSPNISNVITATDGGLFTGLIPTGVLGLANQYPQLQTLLDKHLLDLYKPRFDAVRHQCFVANVADFLFTKAVKMLDTSSVFTQPDVMAILNANAMGAATPHIPMYVYKSVLDEVSPVQDTDSVVDTYCNGPGAVSVTYVRDALSEHGIMAVVGFPRALVWLRDRLNGKAPTPGCSKNTVISSLLDPSTLDVVPEFLIDALLDLIGKPVGSVIVG